MCGKKPLNYNLNYTGYNLDDERMKTLMASPNFQTFRKKVQDLKEFIKEILPDLQRAAPKSQAASQGGLRDPLRGKLTETATLKEKKEKDCSN